MRRAGATAGAEGGTPGRDFPLARAICRAPTRRSTARRISDRLAVSVYRDRAAPTIVACITRPPRAPALAAQAARGERKRRITARERSSSRIIYVLAGFTSGIKLGSRGRPGGRRAWQRATHGALLTRLHLCCMRRFLRGRACLAARGRLLLRRRR